MNSRTYPRVPRIKKGCSRYDRAVPLNEQLAALIDASSDRFGVPIKRQSQRANRKERLQHIWQGVPRKCVRNASAIHRHNVSVCWGDNSARDVLAELVLLLLQSRRVAKQNSLDRNAKIVGRIILHYLVCTNA